MAKALPSAAQAAASWQAGFAAAGPKWQAGVDAVTTAPGIDAAAAKDRYAAGVNANIDKWASRTAGVSVQTWKDACKTKGAQRLSSGAQVGMSKYQTQIQKVLDAERSILPSLPPRGDVLANIQRSNAFQLAMHQAFQS